MIDKTITLQHIKTFESIINECEVLNKNPTIITAVYNNSLDTMYTQLKDNQSENTYEMAMEYAFSRMRDYIYFGDSYLKCNR